MTFAFTFAFFLMIYPWNSFRLNGCYQLNKKLQIIGLLMIALFLIIAQQMPVLGVKLYHSELYLTLKFLKVIKNFILRNVPSSHSLNYTFCYSIVYTSISDVRVVAYLSRVLESAFTALEGLNKQAFLTELVWQFFLSSRVFL